MDWKTVYVFVSSTFNDMHAERDLLVKRVFPALRLWCAQRKLQLRDIDLRWGVSAADAQENKRVVEVCLRNIDKCRPFFLCFMGQRRGWVPQAQDVNPDTLEAFPDLRSVIGSASVTEMEVFHALLKPLASGVTPVRHARFYFRDGAYTKSLRSQAHKDLFIPNRGVFHKGDKDVDAFKKRLAQQHSTVTYTAKWNPDLPSPELTGELAKGRLEDFRAGEHTLEEDVLAWLKQTIAQEYPDHQELPPAAGELERELDRQDTQRFQCSDGYIPRPAEEQALARSLENAGTRPLVLLAQAGCGKTSLLAAFLNSYHGRKVYYRFVGTTPQSFRLDTLSASLTEQWVADGLLPEDILQYTPAERKMIFSTLCIQAARKKPFLLVLDGMDQLLGNEDWKTWLPSQMPQGAGLLMSLRDTGETLPEHLAVHRLGFMEDPNDKAMMAKAYLGNFLKDIDDAQMAQLLAMEGSSNPLYMKIVLNELRQHGSFDTLMAQFTKNYGSTPLTAFRQVIARVEREMGDKGYDVANATVLFFGCLAYAQQGLDGNIFLWACRNLNGWDEDVISDRQVLDLIYGLARELEPFLVMDGDRIALRYDSMRQAIKADYPRWKEENANILLAQAFLWRLGTYLKKEDVQTTLLHVEQSAEYYIRHFFTHPARLPLLVQYGGTEMVAKTCDYLVWRRGLKEYGDLSLVLRKAAARLQTNPRTFFMELDRYGDHDNPITAELLRRQGEYDTGVVLRPQYSAEAAKALRWELPHPASSSGCEVWAAPYFVFISGGVLKVIDLRTRETVHVMYMPKLGAYSLNKLAAGDNMLYVVETNMRSDWIKIQSYRLPDMLPISQPVEVESPYGAIWDMQIYREKLYVMQFHRDRSKTQGGEYTLVCLSTGKVIFRMVTENDFHYNLCGGWLVYRDDGSGICRVLSLEDGRCLLEDQFLGTDHMDPEFAKRLTGYGRLFANKANMQAAFAEKLFIWKSGSVVDPEKGIQLRQRMLRLAPTADGLTLEKTWDEVAGHHTVFANLSDKYLVTESQGYLDVMDGECNLLGRLNLGGRSDPAYGGKNPFGQLDDQLILFYKDRICGYDLQQLVAALEPDMEPPFVGRRSSALVDGQLYVMDIEMERFDLKTRQMTKEPVTQTQYWEQYDPWNMQGQDLWIGYGVKSGSFTIKRPQTLERLGRFKMPNADSRELCSAFLFRNQNGIQMVGLIQGDKGTNSHMMKGEKQTFMKLWLRTKPLTKLYGNDPWSERNLNVETAVAGMALGMYPTSVSVGGKPYLLLPNVYKDQWTVQLRVFDVLQHTTVYTKDMDLHDGSMLDRDTFRPFPNGVIYTCGRFETGKTEILDLTVKKVYYINRWLLLLTVDPLAEQQCMYDRNSRELLLYDTETRKLDKITTLEKEFRPHQAILLQRHVILTQQYDEAETVLIYDRESGKLLCSQRLEQRMEDAVSDGDVIAVVDSNSRKFFWSVEEYEK